MNKYFKFNFLFILIFLIFSTVKSNSKNIIPNSSYIVYEKTHPIRGADDMRSRYRDFYSYDGEFIARDNKIVRDKKFGPRIYLSSNKLYPCTFSSSIIDPKAPKPKPVKYEIQHWTFFIAPGIRKGDPGNFIIFYDKNNNIIESFRFDENKICVRNKNPDSDNWFIKYDLNHEIKKPIDFRLDLSALQPMMDNYKISISKNFY